MSDPGNSLYPFPTVIPELAIRHETRGFDDAPMQCIERILNEEEDTEKWSMFHDPLALQAMENSFFQALRSDTVSLSPVVGRPDGAVAPSWSIETNGPVNSPFHADLVTNALSASDPAAILRREIKPLRRETTQGIDLGTTKSNNANPWRPTLRKNNGPVLDNGRETEVEETTELFERLFLVPSVGHSSAGPVSVKSNRPKKLRTEEEIVDLGDLIHHCAEAIAVDDRGPAYEVLKQIREHSSATGDGTQRCAHYFANGLEARLAGAQKDHPNGLEPELPPLEDLFKTSKALLSVCPFRAVDFSVAEHHILRLAEKAQTLHIIDFGIFHCFRWFSIIECLAARPRGPPRLRITGIEYPRPGIGPTELVEGERRCLLKFCERFNVRCEYNGIIAQKWEMIRVEDLEIRKNEKIVVNCTLRFEKLLDETVGVNNPRSIVLGLIRKMNPDIFIHTIINGALNLAAFHMRLREALYHFSAIFDMLDSLFTRESEERKMIEREYLGWSVLNVVACEGSERVERVETYKHWQVRMTNAGFRRLLLDRELTKTLKAMVKSTYHKEFLIEEDGNWLLQGWKGRILYATSCWVPD